MEGREVASFSTSLVTMLGSVLIEGMHLMMITTTTKTISRETTIKGMENSRTKEKGMLLLLIKETFALPRDQETPCMMNLMLLITSKNNYILYLPFLLHLLWTLLEIG